MTLRKAQHLLRDDITAEQKKGLEVDKDTNHNILCKQLVDLVQAEIESEKVSEQPSTIDKDTEGNGRSKEQSEVNKTETSDVSSDKCDMAENTKPLFHLKTDN